MPKENNDINNTKTSYSKIEVKTAEKTQENTVPEYITNTINPVIPPEKSLVLPSNDGESINDLEKKMLEKTDSLETSINEAKTILTSEKENSKNKDRATQKELFQIREELKGLKLGSKEYQEALDQIAKDNNLKTLALRKDMENLENGLLNEFFGNLEAEWAAKDAENREKDVNKWWVKLITKIPGISEEQVLDDLSKMRFDMEYELFDSSLTERLKGEYHDFVEQKALGIEEEPELVVPKETPKELSIITPEKETKQEPELIEGVITLDELQYFEKDFTNRFSEQYIVPIEYRIEVLEGQQIQELEEVKEVEVIEQNIQQELEPSEPIIEAEVIEQEFEPLEPTIEAEVIEQEPIILSEQEEIEDTQEPIQPENIEVVEGLTLPEILTPEVVNVLPEIVEYPPVAISEVYDEIEEVRGELVESVNDLDKQIVEVEKVIEHNEKQLKIYKRRNDKLTRRLRNKVASLDANAAFLVILIAGVFKLIMRGMESLTDGVYGLAGLDANQISSRKQLINLTEEAKSGMKNASTEERYNEYKKQAERVNAIKEKNDISSGSIGFDVSEVPFTPPPKPKKQGESKPSSKGSVPQTKTEGKLN